MNSYLLHEAQTLTKINYTIPYTDIPQNVTLKVYNLLREVVAILVNEIQPAGNYTAEFSAEGLSSGVYFYIPKAKWFSDFTKIFSLFKRD